MNEKNIEFIWEATHILDALKFWVELWHVVLPIAFLFRKKYLQKGKKINSM
jgi:hypothetical protein